jgi:hypothetical protein
MTRQAALAQAMEFDGMTGVEALALMDIFIGRAVRDCGGSRFAEFGAYRGRTASLMAQHVGPDGGLEIVEVADYLQFERLQSQHGPRVRWHKQKSEAFTALTLPGLLGRERLVATHHDASHFFDNVRTELANIRPLLHERAVIILDDFNDTYAQVRAAYYHLRYTADYPFEVLLIGFNKCILVHGDHFAAHEAFVLEHLIDVLENDYGYLCRLARTDSHRLSRGFNLTLRPTPEADKRYGIAFFGDRFYRPAR